MIIINTSSTLAELLPEIHHSFDPDLPMVSDDLSVMFKKYVRDIILHAIFVAVARDRYYESRWLESIRNDRFLRDHGPRIMDVELIDGEGTYILIFEEDRFHEHR